MIKFDRLTRHAGVPDARSISYTSKRMLQGLINYRGHRAAYARELFYRLAGHFTPMVLSTAGPFVYCVPTRDAYLGPGIFSWGVFEPEYVQRVLYVLERVHAGCCAPKTFVDIGANIGTTTIPMLVDHGFERAIALEPEPTNFQMLRANIGLNGLEHRVDCINAGLSDVVGEAIMEKHRTNCGGHSIVPSNTSISEQQCSVRVTTFDTLVADGAIHLDQVGLVWMDTQGHEGRIFTGAASLLRSNIPVLTEFSPDLLRQAEGLEHFEEAVASNYSCIVDIRTLDSRQSIHCVPAEMIGEFTRSYQRKEDFTDLLLLKSWPES